jgi:hypothetical protein
VEVPAAVELLERVAVTEGVRVLGGKPIEFDFLEAAGQASHDQLGVEQKLLGGVGEGIGGVGWVRKRRFG